LQKERQAGVTTIIRSSTNKLSCNEIELERCTTTKSDTKF